MDIVSSVRNVIIVQEDPENPGEGYLELAVGMEVPLTNLGIWLEPTSYKVDPSLSVVLALSTTTSRGAPTGVISSQPGTILLSACVLILHAQLSLTVSSHCTSLLPHNHSDAISASLLSRRLSCLPSNPITPEYDSQGSPQELSNKAPHANLYWKTP
uniref:Ankyrin_rpt-contain_dom domain-containing protein n=1 Tax=Magallana gigas TaxID=29159 RepID=A0A8W8NX05_MAGGI